MDLFILYSVMLSVFIGYVGAITAKYGILSSISDSYYKLPKKWNILFTLFCWGFAFPAMVMGLQLTDNFFMFIASSGIMFVGAAAKFKEKLTHTVHVIGACCGVFGSQLSIAFDFHMYWLNVLFLILGLLILIFNLKNKIWWLEILAFSIICYLFGSKVL